MKGENFMLNGYLNIDIQKDNLDIYVESEFAPLKKVVLAQSEFALPPRKLDEAELAFLTPEARQLFENIQGVDHAEAFPERQRDWEKERENFEALLVRYGVEVYKPRLLTKAEKDANYENGYSNFFVRDPFFTVGNVVIEGSLRFPHRRHEVLPVRDVFHKHVMDKECFYIAAPQPEIAEKGDLTLGAGPFIEGGDVLVLGKHVFVGQSGLASNNLGAKWLSKLLSPFGYTVETVRLKPDILHLDCALGLVREGLMIICESALIDGVPEILKKWDRIDIREEETSLLATNGLPLNPDVYALDPVFAHIGEKLEQHGTKVESIDFKITRSFGGSFRCSTQPLLRR